MKLALLGALTLALIPAAHAADWHKANPNTLYQSYGQSGYFAGTDSSGNLQPPAAGVRGGVLPATAPTHEFGTGIDTTGAPQFAQPAFGDLSGTAAPSQLPAATTVNLGAVQVGTGLSVSSGTVSLPSVNTSGAGTYGNVTTDAQGRITAVRAPAFTDVTGTATLGQIPTIPASQTSGLVATAGGNANATLAYPSGAPIQRTQQQRASDRINAADYFVCDGATDNATAVATVNTLLAAKNKTLYFPASLGALPCLTSTPITLALGDSMIGDSSGVTLATTQGNTHTSLLFNAQGNNVISGLTFDGGGAEFTGSSSGTTLTVTAVGTGRLYVGQVLAWAGTGTNFASPTTITAYGTGTGGVGTYTESQANTISSENMVAFFGGSGSYLLNMSAQSNALLSNDVFQNAKNIGMNIGTSSNVAFAGDTFVNIGQYWLATGLANSRHQAIAFSVSGSGESVTSSTFTDIGLDAISFGAVSNSVASGNTCNLSLLQLTALPTSTYPACVYANAATGLTITGNRSYNALGNSYDIYQSNNVSITGNVAVNSGSAGVGIFGGSAHNVTGNTISDSGQWASAPFPGGVSFSGSSNNDTVSGNVVFDDQGTPTQKYGIWGNTGSTYSNLTIGANTLTGNLTGPLGGVFGPPGVTSCGTSPSITANSSRLSGTVTAGSGATTCTLTFGDPFSIVKGATVTSRSGLAGISYTPATATLVVTATGLGGTTFDYTMSGQ
jgi:hypothetical protein